MDDMNFDDIDLLYGDPYEDEQKRKAKARKESILLYLHDFVCLLAGVFLVFLLLFRVVVVSGASMNNTLVDGDYLLLLNNVFYPNPQAGDIVVAAKSSFEDGEPIIKRIIATQGQEVYIDYENGIVYVDGKPENYTEISTNLKGDMENPCTVQPGCVFVMGDNRNRSKDSRFTEIGLIDIREIMGKAIFLCFPGEDNNGNERDFGRIGVIS